MDDLKALTRPELMAELGRVKAEITRRHTVESGAREADALNRKHLAAAGVEPCQPWRQPTHALDAYPRDWRAHVEDVCWVSLIPGNMTRPGDNPEHWEIYVEPEPEEPVE